LLGEQYKTLYVPTPHPTFDYKQVYKVGDVFFWNDYVYTCQIATQILDHQAQLNIGVAISTPVANIFPNDTEKGVQYWGEGVLYDLEPDTLDSLSEGDARDQKLLQICVDITLYHLHCRIAPRNIPQLRIDRYMGLESDRISNNQRILYPTYSALGWLQSASIGNDITPEMPILQPESGKRTLWGGNVKSINTY